MRIIAVFNDRSGVGKSSLVYHLAWMFAELGHRVVAADLDPQASLSAMFLDDDRIGELWEEGSEATTPYDALEPLRRTADVRPATLVPLSEQLALLPGHVGLGSLEGVFAENWAESWAESGAGKPVSHVATSSLARVLERVGREHQADVVLVDVGANLGAMSRATLLAADDIIIPLVADLFSVVGLRELGRTLRQWRTTWQGMRAASPPELALPRGELQPLGYVMMQHAIRKESRSTKTYQRWMRRIPSTYRAAVLGLDGEAPSSVQQDPECLAVLPRYPGLMSMAQDARKPIFRLSPADGAMGAHAYAVQDARRELEQLVETIAKRSGAAP